MNSLLMRMERALLWCPAAVFWWAAARRANLDTKIEHQRHRRANTEVSR